VEPHPYCILSDFFLYIVECILINISYYTYFSTFISKEIYFLFPILIYVNSQQLLLAIYNQENKNILLMRVKYFEDLFEIWGFLL
jgi:hypothetical protein